jgi:hypothetical protein
MATKTQVTRLLAKQGAVWSEKKFFDEYEFEAMLPEPYVWNNGHSDNPLSGLGSFAQTKMSGESMADFWQDVMSLIDHDVVVCPYSEAALKEREGR